MRLFRRITHVCQNCVFGDNDKGERLVKRYYPKNDWLDDKGEWVELRAIWHVFCRRRNKLVRWGRYKRCYVPKMWLLRPRV